MPSFLTDGGLCMAGHTMGLLSAKRLGLYLQCEQVVLEQALTCQQQLAVQGICKRLGEILLERRIVSRDILWKALQAQRRDRLRNCAVFADLDERVLAVLCELVEERGIPAGEEFIHQDDIGDRF